MSFLMENDDHQLLPNSSTTTTTTTGGKRKRSEFVSCEEQEEEEEEDPENRLKVSRVQWQQQQQQAHQQGSRSLVRTLADNNVTKQGAGFYHTKQLQQAYHSSHQQQLYLQAAAPLVLDNSWSPILQQQQDFMMTDNSMAAAEATANHHVPALNMKQKSMAAAMLRDLRSISSDPSKFFLQTCQLQQLLPCATDPITTQLPALVPAPPARSLVQCHQEHSIPLSCQLDLAAAQSLQLPGSSSTATATAPDLKPLVQKTSSSQILLSPQPEPDFRHGESSPTSSSSSPYPGGCKNLQNATLVLHNCSNNNNPEVLVQKQLPESNERENPNGALLFHGSPSPNFLQQGSQSSMSKSLVPPQQQQQHRSVHSSLNVLLQQPSSLSMHSAQSTGLTHQQQQQRQAASGILHNGLTLVQQQQQQQQQGSSQLHCKPQTAARYGQAANGAILQHDPPPPSHTSQHWVAHQQSAANHGLLQNGPQNGLLQNGSQNGFLQNASPNGFLQNGSQNGLLQNGFLQNVSQNGLMQNGAQNGSQNGPKNGFLQNVLQNGLVQNGSKNGFLKNASQNGLVQNGLQNGLLQNGSKNGFLQNVSQNGLVQNGSQNGFLQNGMRNRSMGSGLQNSGLQNHGMMQQHQQGHVKSLQQNIGVGLHQQSGHGATQHLLSGGHLSQNGIPNRMPQQQQQQQPIMSGGGNNVTPPCESPPLVMTGGDSTTSWHPSSSPSAAGVVTLSPGQLPLQGEVHGPRRMVQGSYCSSSSSGVEPPPPTAFVNANSNEGPDNNNLSMQGGASCPPKLVRSFTKVYKLGSITRALNVNQFSNYAELRSALARMFNLECQLDQELGWKLVFLDNENDLLLLGDDPWEVFVSTVRAIRILSPAEVSFCMSSKEEESGVCL